MATEPIITSERVDDIPLLLTQIERMGIKKLIDKHFPTHGNWQGESLGNVAVIWLTHAFSQPLYITIDFISPLTLTLAAINS
jgi:hypothetical protein